MLSVRDAACHLPRDTGLTKTKATCVPDVSVSQEEGNTWERELRGDLCLSPDGSLLHPVSGGPDCQAWTEEWGLQRHPI